MPAGELRGRFTFSSISEVDDPMGAKRGAPVAQFKRSCKLVPIRGGEQVMAARLESRQPCILTVRQDSQTRTVNTDWQVSDDASGAVYNIRTITDPDQKRAYFDMLIESGVAA